MRTPDQTNRGGNGRYVKSLDTVRRDADAAAMRARGATYQDVAAALGYASRGAACEGVSRALAAVPVEAADELRAVERIRLDAITARAWDIAMAEHPMISYGRVVDGVNDPGPVLHALEVIRRVSESRRRLLGIDAPIRRAVEVITNDVIMAEIERLSAELGVSDPTLEVPTHEPTPPMNVEPHAIS